MSKHKAINFMKILPYATAVVVFLALIVIYFYPVFEGKKLYASDMVHYKGISKEIIDYRAKTGDEALWTNSLFGGMPAYQISVEYDDNMMKIVHKILRLNYHFPVGMVIIYFLGFYILLLVLRVNPWLSITGAIAFAFSSYFFIILEAGHLSKAYAIGYMPMVLAGFILAYRGKYIYGGILAATALSLEILSGHPQITYYLMFMVVIYGLAELIRHYREKRMIAFLKASGILIAAVFIALLTHAANLWSTYEYSKYSIRGKTELASEKENRTSGLDKDYATDWSYGIPETMTLLIPNFQGGSSQGSLSKNSETYKLLTKNRIPNADKIINALPLYWGPQPFTSGPVYAGAIIIFLFIFSLFYLKGPIKWWGITVTLLSITLAWGKHFMPLTNFFLENVPLYNKFRAVAMTLVMAEVSIPLLAIIAVDQLIRDTKKIGLIRYLKWTLYITGGVLLFFILLAGSLFSFSSPSDASQGLPDWLITAVRDDRLSIFRTDAIRSLVFILVAFGLMWAYLTNKLKLKYVLIILPILILADMWPVNKRYLNDDDFIKKNQVDNPYLPTKADLSILKDPDPYYRVYNFNEAFDQSARTSYFHKNLGGYHGAKLRRYQEIIETPLTRERMMLIESLGGKGIPVEKALQNANVFNMLNTKYFIVNANADPLRNPFACGNAWFVGKIEMVNNADEEMAALASFDPESVAVVDKCFENYLIKHPVEQGPGGKIELTGYSPNKLTYSYISLADQFAVFSEIYYDKGWKAFLDGKELPHIRVNYILRGMALPKGEHHVEFRFEPKSYFVGQSISLVSSIFLLLLIISALIYYFRQSLKGPGQLTPTDPDI